MIYVYIGICLIVPLVFCVWLVRQPRFRGKFGEWRVKRVLKERIKYGDTVIHNLILKNLQTGMTAQIDHVLVTEGGVFVIETKNYAGRIYGDDDMREWTQVLNYGKIKNKFYSPVKQNATHIYILRQYIGKDIPVYNVVVFVQNNIEYIKSDSVYTLPDLKRLFRLPYECVPQARMKETAERLRELKENPPATETQHLKNIRKQQMQIAANICPRCGGELVLRNGAYGKFYGCSNYPKCKFTKNL